MGMHADDALDVCFEVESMVHSWLHGEMDIIDAIDAGVLDEHGALIGPRRAKTVTCRCCGLSGLHWSQIDGKWRLFTKDGIHQCKVNPLHH